MANLLLEIGTEEIPARFMPGIIAQLEKKVQDIFADERIEYGELKVYGTPRRIALVVRELADMQKDLVKKVKGPSLKAAYDAEKNPTKASLGFCRGQGVDVNELTVENLDGVDYVYAVVKKSGEKTEDVLPGLLTDIIKGLSFPKNMRWGSEEFAFVRPIRWMVALLDKNILPIEIAGIKADKLSRGHRFLATGDVLVESAEDYVESLRKAFVIVDQEERKEVIVRGLAEAAEATEGILDADEELLEEVVYLVEYPTAFVGAFDKKYLVLPKEVVITPMKEQQRYFPVLNPDGSLLPKFIGVRNGDSNGLGKVIAGNEKVLVARLEDARFFYEEDINRPLAEMVKKLDKVVFQEKLGSYGEKVVRIEKIACRIGEMAGWQNDLENISTCAKLAKADLMSAMVYEFPELQGIMGEYYGLVQGLDQEVAKGIREHYHPRFAGDTLAESRPGIAVAIADKLDSIIGIIGAGMKPTGSQDPYALRRQALGIVLTLEENNLDLDIEKVIEYVLTLYGEAISLDIEDLKEFFNLRLKAIMEEKGIRYDLIDAVLAASDFNFTDTLRKADALKEFSQSSEFDALVAGFTRAANLSTKSEGAKFEEKFLEADAEIELHKLLTIVESETGKYREKKEYLKILNEISSLRAAIDNFFDSTMVMVEDKKIRDNRLALLDRIVALTADISDLSKVVG